METGIVFSAIGIASSAVLGGLGASIGMVIAGSKATGVIAEKADLFIKVMIMTALPGSQAVYGLLISFLIINRMGGMETVSPEVGIKFMFAGILMGLAALFSGWFQGRVAAGGIGAIARNESLLGGAIILAALVETSAIFGLLIAILFLPQ